MSLVVGSPILMISATWRDLSGGRQEAAIGDKLQEQESSISFQFENRDVDETLQLSVTNEDELPVNLIPANFLQNTFSKIAKNRLDAATRELPETAEQLTPEENTVTTSTATESTPMSTDLINIFAKQLVSGTTGVHQLDEEGAENAANLPVRSTQNSGNAVKQQFVKINPTDADKPTIRQLPPAMTKSGEKDVQPRRHGYVAGLNEAVIDGDVELRIKSTANRAYPVHKPGDVVARATGNQKNSGEEKTLNPGNLNTETKNVRAAEIRILAHGKNTLPDTNEKPPTGRVSASTELFAEKTIAPITIATQKVVPSTTLSPAILIVDAITKNISAAPVSGLKVPVTVPGAVPVGVNYSIEVQLIPKNLGIVEVMINRTGQQLSISIQTNNASAEAILKSEIQAISKSLASSGFALDDIIVKGNMRLEQSIDISRRETSSVADAGIDNSISHQAQSHESRPGYKDTMEHRDSDALEQSGRNSPEVEQKIKKIGVYF